MEVPEWCKGVERHGGLLGPTQRPFPQAWDEDAVWFDCETFRGGHRWELVYLTGARAEYFVRCIICRVPRCSDSGSVDPCILRRHHRPDHRPLSHWVPALTDPDEVARWLET